MADAGLAYLGVPLTLEYRAAALRRRHRAHAIAGVLAVLDSAGRDLLHRGARRTLFSHLASVIADEAVSDQP